MAEVASAYVSLMPSAKGFGRGISNQIGGDLDSAGRTGGKRFGKGMSTGMVGMGKTIFGPLAAVGAAMLVGNFFKGAYSEARESQKVGALTANVIKTTGGVAKITAGQVGDLAMAISNKTGVDDEAIQHGANLLLTFKNVRNEVGKGSQIFNRATAAAADLSASGFGDLAGSSKMLGKALNDPLKGITALGRAGVTFSAGQKKQIEGFVKAGDLLSAQKIIMKEVESQVGGAAAASATAGEKLSTTWGNLKEQVGTALLPAIDKAMTAVSGFLGGVMESFQKGGLSRVFTDIGTKIGAALPGIKTQLAKWGTAFWAWIQVAGPPMLVKLGGLVGKFETWAFTVAYPAIVATLVKWGKAFVEWIAPMIPPMLVKLGDLLTRLGIWIWTVGFPTLQGKLAEWGRAFWAWIVPAIGPMLATLGGMLQRLGVWIGTVALPAILSQLGRWAWAFIKWVGPMIPPMLLELGKLLLKLVGWLLTVALPAIIIQLSKWSKAFFMWVPGATARLIAAMIPLLGKLVGWILGTALPAIIIQVAKWGVAFLAWVANTAASMPGKLIGLLLTLTAWARTVPGKIVSALGNLGSLLYNAGQEAIQGLINGVGSMVSRLAGAMADAVKRGITDLLPGSPVKKGPLRVLNRGYAGGQIVKMLTGGIDSQRASMEASMTGLVSLPRVGSLDFASSADRASAVAGGGIDYDRLASAMSRVQIGLDGRNVAASVDQRLAPR